MDETLIHTNEGIVCPVTQKSITKHDGILVTVPDNKNIFGFINYCVKDILTLQALSACPLTFHAGEYRYVKLHEISTDQWEQLQKYKFSNASWNGFKNTAPIFFGTFSNHQPARGNINFKNANLTRAKLSGADFSGANFIGAILIESDLSDCNLTDAQLISANLQKANLENANLTRANFSKSNLNNSRLVSTTLTDTNFESAKLINANFTLAKIGDKKRIGAQDNHSESLSALQKPYDQLKKMAFYDLITGVYNRQAFEEFFEREITDLSRYKYNSALFLADLDNFKTVNDTHGHLIGDALLKEVAIRLQKIVRQGDLISRFGGDEFALYFKNIQNESDLAHIAKKTIESISKPYLLEQKTASVGISIGICYCKHDTQLKTKDILSRADIALYSAKSNGRNCYHLYSQ